MLGLTRSRSYGRNSNFLLRIGFDQIQTILGEYSG